MLELDAGENQAALDYFNQALFEMRGFEHDENYGVIVNNQKKAMAMLQL